MPARLAPLPIDVVLPEAAAALAEHGALVLRSPTGSGKTTRLPPALSTPDAGGGAGRVVVLEPRRLAARAAALRVAEEHGWELGGRVGYHVRFDRRAGAETRLLYVTEGLLVRMLQDDPFLEGIGTLVFDEFHERSLDADLALAMAARVRREARPDLRLVVMSATLDPAPIAAFLDGAPVVETTGRLHPVAVRHAGVPVARDPRSLATAVAAGVGELLAESGGDLLVFLPGVGEIRAAEEALGPLARRHDLALVSLHGGLPLGEQGAALRPGDRRKVVLATNVAESSVTVAGVTAVVDTGLARRLRYDPGSGLNRLELGRVSRASADQRAGRAGREAPGICLRLWPEIEHAALPAGDVPEVARIDLSGAVLQLLAWGEADAAAFPWFEPPPARSLAAAEELLALLGATGSAGLTPLGRELARLPVHPRLGRLLLAAGRQGYARDAALAAALLSERPPFARQGGGAAAVRASRSDLLDRVDALAAFERGGRVPPPFTLQRGAARFVLKVRDRLAGLVAEGGARRPRAGVPGASMPRDEALLRAVFAAHPDRLCRRRAPGSPQAVMVGGRGVVLARESAVVEPELFVAVDLDDLGGGRPGVHTEALVRLASAVERDWLPEAAVETADEVAFDSARERVVAHRVTRYADLELDRREIPAPPEAAAAALAQAALAAPERALALDAPRVAAFLDRVAFLRRWRPELGLPDLAGGREALLAELVPAWIAASGARSFAELRRAPLLDLLRGGLTHEQLRAIEREAPESWELPTGTRARLEYRGEEAPVLAARIQELFGVAETPRVAGGRVAVLLHLLAPNRRPQQVTDDLAGFWTRTYPEVKKELAGRYPKHAWPDDPLAARPQRK